jgi:hypothetical protein
MLSDFHRLSSDSPMRQMQSMAAALLRVRATINSQIFSVQTLAQQGAEIKEYLAYSVFLQRS